MRGKVRRYESEGIVVEYEAGRCIHAEECIHGLPKVFDPEARPWIQPAHASADAIAEIVRKCPTGALRDERTDGGAAEAPAAENTVRLVADGPLYLAGRLRIENSDGEILEETRAALCRCGASQNKPFCDNAHREISFSDPATPVEHRLRPNGDSGEGHLKIKLAENGPILIEGPLRVVAVGVEVSEGGGAALCRCGASEVKPYCDGAHVAAGFTSD